MTDTLVVHRAMTSNLRQILLALASNGRATVLPDLVGAWDWDVQEDRLYFDVVGARIFCIEPREAAAGTTIQRAVSAIHPDDAIRVSADIERATTNQSFTFSQTYRVRRQEGGYRWVHAMGRCTFDAHGRPLRYPGAVIDVSGGSPSASLDVVRPSTYDTAADLLLLAEAMARQSDDPFLSYLCKVALSHIARNGVRALLQ